MVLDMKQEILPNGSLARPSRSKQRLYNYYALQGIGIDTCMTGKRRMVCKHCTF